MCDFVSVYIADVLDLGLDRLYTDMMRFLHQDDCKKISAYKCKRDRLLSLTGRIMIRALAMGITGHSDIDLGFSEFGKPYFEHDGLPQFNLSHSENLVVLAFGKYPVGVDIEYRRDIDWEDVASFFSDAERTFVASGSNQLDCFYKIWTIREAVSKLEGIGLSVFDSDSFFIDFEKKKVQLNEKTIYFDCHNISGYALCVSSQQYFDVDINFLSPVDWQDMMKLMSRDVKDE